MIDFNYLKNLIFIKSKEIVPCLPVIHFFIGIKKNINLKPNV